MVEKIMSEVQIHTEFQGPNVLTDYLQSCGTEGERTRKLEMQTGSFARVERLENEPNRDEDSSNPL